MLANYLTDCLDKYQLMNLGPDSAQGLSSYPQVGSYMLKWNALQDAGVAFKQVFIPLQGRFELNA
jgi:hypothetical protein